MTMLHIRDESYHQFSAEDKVAVVVPTVVPLAVFILEDVLDVQTH